MPTTLCDTGLPWALHALERVKRIKRIACGPWLALLPASLIAAAASAAGAEVVAAARLIDEPLPVALQPARELSSLPSSKMTALPAVMTWMERGGHAWGFGIAPLGTTLAWPAATLAVGRELKPGMALRLSLSQLIGAGNGLVGSVPVDTDEWQRREISLGLAFDTSRHDLRSKLALRMDLAGGTQISLRPRNGRLSVLLRSQW